MANAEQLAILKQGVEVWNKWRWENQNTVVDLSEANLSAMNLERAALWHTNLSGANLSYTKLHKVELFDSDLSNAILQNARLSFSDLSRTNFSNANLVEADLLKAFLIGTKFKNANLKYADFSYAEMRATNLENVNVLGAKFKDTMLSNVSLDTIINLDKIIHSGPSILDISVFQQTKTPLPKEFTRGCGWQDWQVKSMELDNPALTPDQVVDVLYEVERLRNGSPLQVHNLFISHSRKDVAFIDFIGKQLEQRNILYWLDVRDATAGPLEKQIDKAIRLNQTFLLVLSEHSCESDWVEWELEKARQLEKESGRHVICPIELDSSWENGNLSERIKLQIKKYNVLDFSQWQEPTIFAKQFERLIKGLDLFYRPT